jgi:hypothetical protein
MVGKQKARVEIHITSRETITRAASQCHRHVQPLRPERRSRDRFVKMVEDTERWYERFYWAKPGNGPGRSPDVDMVAFLAMLLPTPNHGHDRAEAAATVTALCRGSLRRTACGGDRCWPRSTASRTAPSTPGSPKPTSPVLNG